MVTKKKPRKPWRDQPLEASETPGETTTQPPPEQPAEPEGADRADAIIGDDMHRCRLCPDGGRGKVLLPCRGSLGEKMLACQRHVGFYQREVGYDADLSTRTTKRRIPAEGIAPEPDDSPSNVKMSDK